MAPSRILAVAALALGLAQYAWAHIGPPYLIMENRHIGALKVEVWSNPDVGTGSFFVVLDPLPEQAIPLDLKVQVAVQPVSRRLPEVMYDAWRENLKSRIEFKAVVPFDKEEMWHVRVMLSSTTLNGETGTDVPVTPTLLGRWNLLLFLLPFLGIGFLWFKAVSVKRKRRRKVRRAPTETAASTGMAEESTMRP